MSIKTTQLKELNVLYVEDEIGIRRNVQDCLDFIFKNTYVAENGQEGIELFKNEDIDIVITDINMPIKDGISMIKEIREISSLTPIIVTTAYSRDTIIDAKGLDVNGFLLKPFDIKELLDNVVKVAL